MFRIKKLTTDLGEPNINCKILYIVDDYNTLHVKYGNTDKLIYNVNDISYSSHYSVIHTNNGDVYSMGNNYSRALGIPIDKPIFRRTPEKICIPKCKQVSTGDSFSICVTANGELYGFGSNHYGQTEGTGRIYINSYSNLLPRPIKGINNVKFVRCGGYHVICVTLDNKIYGWGDNSEGQLGQGELDIFKGIIDCENFNAIEVKDVQCGWYNTALLSNDGKVYSCGRNCAGELGIGNKSFNVSVPTLIKGIPTMKKIICKKEVTMLIDENAKLWCCGRNSYGQLGIGRDIHYYKPVMNEYINDVCNVITDGFTSFAKTMNNEIYVFGKVNHLELYLGAKHKFLAFPKRIFEDMYDEWFISNGKTVKK